MESTKPPLVHLTLEALSPPSQGERHKSMSHSPSLLEKLLRLVAPPFNPIRLLSPFSLIETIVLINNAATILSEGEEECHPESPYGTS